MRSFPEKATTLGSYLGPCGLQLEAEGEGRAAGQPTAVVFQGGRFLGKPPNPRSAELTIGKMAGTAGIWGGVKADPIHCQVPLFQAAMHGILPCQELQSDLYRAG